MLARLRAWYRRWKYRDGRVLSQFIARDVRREIRILSTAKLNEGIITGQMRTMNLLYTSHKLVPSPEFEPPRELDLDTMWQWSGKSWGGLPDGTSIVDTLDNSRN